MSTTESLEQIYREHHTTRRGEFFLVNGDVRGEYLRTHIGKGKKVLDIGCRDGALTGFYSEGNTVTGIDIDSEALARAKERFGIETIHADLNGAWPVTGGFDAVVACEIIEHLYYPEQVLQKINDQLVHSGILVGSIPHAFSLQSRLRLMLARKQGTALQDPTHINHFWGPEFKKLIEQAGFVDVEMVDIVSNKFTLLSKLFPYLFAHSFVFKAVKPL